MDEKKKNKICLIIFIVILVLTIIEFSFLRLTPVYVKCLSLDAQTDTKELFHTISKVIVGINIILSGIAIFVGFSKKNNIKLTILVALSVLITIMSWIYCSTAFRPMSRSTDCSQAYECINCDDKTCDCKYVEKIENDKEVVKTIRCPKVEEPIKN